ncbi:MAG: thioredoxin domain-containing protein [Bacteroidetes bacterium]|nr:thioredoxin domain-containing protein [Bacteroidota bacterium]
MNRIITFLTISMITMMAASVPSRAEINTDDREALNQIIETYILENPEVVRRALIALADREANERINAAMSLLQQDDGDPVIGNPEGSFTIYEFSDYNCGYCKRVFPTLQALIDEDDDIRLVIKEFPILSQSSVLAAQAGIATQAQGVFDDFHSAMMTGRGAITMDSILEAAEDAGANLDQLQADMNSPQVAAIINRTRSVAQNLEISGTPGLIIGSQVIPGAIDLDQMRQAVAEERAKKG